MQSTFAPGGTLALRRLAPANRTSQVVAQLTDLILSGEWSDAALLPPERILAEKFGVSRSVVREATQILQSRGLVSIKHGVGTAVNRQSSEPVQRAFSQALHGQQENDALLKLTEVRLLVEVEIASLAAQRATAQDLAEMRALLEEMEAALDEPGLYMELDMNFHRALAKATGNEVFGVVLDASATLSQQARLKSLEAGASTVVSQAMHRAIFRAVAERDAPRAAQEMRNHLQAVQTDLHLSAAGRDEEQSQTRPRLDA